MRRRNRTCRPKHKGKEWDGLDILLEALETDNVDMFAHAMTRNRQLVSNFCSEHVLLHFAASLGSMAMVRLLLDRIPKDQWRLDVGEELYGKGSMNSIRSIGAEMERENIMEGLGVYRAKGKPFAPDVMFELALRNSGAA